MSIKFEGNERSRLYSAELNSIAYANRNAVLDGCSVSADSPASMDVVVSSGRVFFSSEIINITGADVTISANATSFTRLDLVVVSNVGVLSVVTGTPGILPMTPDYDPETYVVLAMITVDSGVTSIISSKIKDIRSINSGGAGGGAGIGSVGKYSQEFTNQTSVTVNHYLADNNPIVQVYDSTGEIIIPDVIETTDENSITVTFSVSTSGFIVVHGGTSGSNAYFTKEMPSAATWNVEHNLANKYVSVTCYDTNDEMIFPESVEIVDEDNITITFGSATDGRVVVMGGIAGVRIDKAIDADITTPADRDILMYNSNSEKWENKSQDEPENVDVLSGTLDVSTVSDSFDLSSLSNCYEIRLANTGSVDCFIDLDGTATTDDFVLVAGSDIVLTNVDFDAVSAITTAGTTTLSVLATSKEFAGSNTNKEILKLSVTDASSEDSFADTTELKNIIIYNSGVNNCYIKLGATATTSDYILESGKAIGFSRIDKHQIAAICDTSLTTTLNILGVW